MILAEDRSVRRPPSRNRHRAAAIEERTSRIRLRATTSRELDRHRPTGKVGGLGFPAASPMGFGLPADGRGSPRPMSRPRRSRHRAPPPSMSRSGPSPAIPPTLSSSTARTTSTRCSRKSESPMSRSGRWRATADRGGGTFPPSRPRPRPNGSSRRCGCAGGCRGDSAALRVELTIVGGSDESGWAPIRLDGQRLIDAREGKRILDLRMV